MIAVDVFVLEAVNLARPIFVPQFEIAEVVRRSDGYRVFHFGAWRVEFSRHNLPNDIGSTSKFFEAIRAGFVDVRRVEVIDARHHARIAGSERTAIVDVEVNRDSRQTLFARITHTILIAIDKDHAANRRVASQLVAEVDVAECTPAVTSVRFDNRSPGKSACSRCVALRRCEYCRPQVPPASNYRC